MSSTRVPAARASIDPESFMPGRLHTPKLRRLASAAGLGMRPQQGLGGGLLALVRPGL